jgi:hypothetical protein
MNVPLMKHPSVLVPLATSVVALDTVLSHAALFGVVHEVDEKTAAHVRGD